MVYLSQILVSPTCIKFLKIHAICLVFHYCVFHHFFSYCSYTPRMGTAVSSHIHFVCHMNSIWVLTMGCLCSNCIIVQQMEPTTAVWFETLSMDSLECPEQDNTGKQFKMKQKEVTHSVSGENTEWNNNANRAVYTMSDWNTRSGRGGYSEVTNEHGTIYSAGWLASTKYQLRKQDEYRGSGTNSISPQKTAACYHNNNWESGTHLIPGW